MNLDEEIVALLKANGVRVLPYPSTALKLRQVAERADHSLDDEVDVVKVDPTMAGAVLRVANSAFYRRGQQTTTLKAAIQRIGSKELLRLALAAGLAQGATAQGPLSPLRRQAWHEALVSALVCQVLSRAVGSSDEEAFVLGLLHDLGKVLALRSLEQILSRHPAMKAQPAAFWMEAVDRYHAELGLVLAAAWELPEIVREVISQHHSDAPSRPHANAVRLVQAGDQVVALLETNGAVSVEMLEAVRWLKEVEHREYVACELPKIASAVASLEAETPKDDRATLVESEIGIALPPPAHPVSVAVNGVVCPAVGLSAAAIAFEGPTSLAPNSLVELELDFGGQRFSFWAKVIRCQQKEGASLLEATPFALTLEAQAAWRVLTGARRDSPSRMGASAGVVSSN